jgi:hypothetical protein
MAAVCAAMYSGGLCSDKMSTQRIVAHEPVARNLIAAMNSSRFRLSLISLRRSRTNHRDDARPDRFGQVLPGSSDPGQVRRHFGGFFDVFARALNGH